MQTAEEEDRARALSCAPQGHLRPAAASTLSPPWLQASPAPTEVVAVFDQAVYLRRELDVLPLLAPDALMLPGALRVATRADLDALGVRVGQRVLVGRGAVHTPGGGLVVRRVWRPQPVPSLPLPAPARQAAAAGLAQLEPPAGTLTGQLTELATGSLVGPAPEDAVRGLVGLGPGLTPAGDDVLCGLLLGLRATGRASGRARLEGAVLPLLGRTCALSATLLRQAAQGYAVPPVVALLRAWHRGAGVPALTLAGRQVAGIGHTSGPALLLGLAAALAAPPTSVPDPRPGLPVTPARPHPEPVLATGATRGTS